jgi:hypothetical protein
MNRSAIAPGSEPNKMDTTFINELNLIRRSHIGYDNQEYSAKMRDLYDRSSGIPTNQMHSLRNVLMNSVRIHPEKDIHTATYVLDLTELFVAPASNERTGPHRLWYRTVDGDIRRLELVLPCDIEVFHAYLSTVDATVQGLRATLHDEFPGADIYHHLDVNYDARTVKFVLDITYSLPPISENDTILESIPDQIPRIWMDVRP